MDFKQEGPSELKLVVGEAALPTEEARGGPDDAGLG
jgi:hypothetical protein